MRWTTSPAIASVNDVSEREFQMERGGTWDKGKGCDTFGPTGPWMVTKDEVSDPQDLPLWTEVNGSAYPGRLHSDDDLQRDQAGQLRQPFHHAARGRCDRNRHPAGRRQGVKPEPIFLKVGDVMRLGVEGLGIQTQRIVGGVAGQWAARWSRHGRLMSRIYTCHHAARSAGPLETGFRRKLLLPALGSRQIRRLSWWSRDRGQCCGCPSSLSDLTPSDIRGRVATSIRRHRRMPP